MSIRYGVSWRGALALVLLLVVAGVASAPARAEDAPDANKPAAAAAKPAAAQKKAPKAAKPPKPAEKSLEEQRAEFGAWAKGTNWLSFRAGYAKSAAKNAGDGLGGYGIGYQHMLNPHWAFGASVHHDLLGHLANSYEISVPMTAEFTRHYKWKTVAQPYVGLGGGYYFHKFYRTGSNYTGSPSSGWYVSTGFNCPIDGRHLLGIDTRMSFVNGHTGTINPVFGEEKANETLWSIKLNWSMVY